MQSKILASLKSVTKTLHDFHEEVSAHNISVQFSCMILLNVTGAPGVCVPVKYFLCLPLLQVPVSKPMKTFFALFKHVHQQEEPITFWTSKI